MRNPLRARVLSRRRAVVVLLLAGGLDAVQLALGPLGWTFADEILDVVGMGMFTLLVGFHPLLLPTFVIELVPIVDMLPTWTACVAAVIVLRKRSHRMNPPDPPVVAGETVPPAEPAGPVIEV